MLLALHSREGSGVRIANIVSMKRFSIIFVSGAKDEATLPHSVF